MSDFENKIRSAYDSVSAPEGLKEKTLSYIAEQEARARSQAQTQPQSQGHIESHADIQDTLTASGSIAVRRRRVSRTFGLALAACVAVFLIGFGGFRMVYLTETAYIGIDINPSLELGINRFDVVVSTQAFNDDARAILDDIDLIGKSYEEAMNALSANKIYQNYITDESFVDISVVCDNQTQSETLQQRSQAYLATLPCEGVCTNASTEVRTEAHDAHMGVGRYQAARILLELDSSLTLEDCEKMSMRELRNRIIAAGGEDPETYHNGHHGQGQGQGSGQSQGSGQGRGQQQGLGNRQ